MVPVEAGSGKLGPGKITGPVEKPVREITGPV